MKIYFLAYSYEKGISADLGGFRKLWELADGLYNQGIAVKIFFPRLPKFFPLKPLPYISYPVFNFSVLRAPSAYLSMFFYALILGLKEKPDIIYFRAIPNIFGAILVKCLRAKLILEVEGSFREFHETIKVSFLRHCLFSVIERFNVHSSDKIIVITPGLKELLVREYKVNPEKIVIVPNGTDTQHFSPYDSKEAKKIIGLDPNRPIVGFAGIFYPHQGVDTLIYAARQILKSYPNTLFFIAGEGIMRKAWEDLAKSEGVENSFLFTGQVPYQKMPIYFNAMDIFTAPFAANRGETSPLKVLDALSCGKVVAASRIPSLDFLTQEFKGSIVVVPADDKIALAKTIVELLSDENKRIILGRKARQIILEKFTWEATAKNVANVLKTMV